MPIDESTFTPIGVGRLQAHVVDRPSRLLLETPSGAVVGSVDLNASRPLLAAADGAWTVDYVQAVPRHRKAHLSVQDGDGREVASVEFAGVDKRIDLGQESLVWQSPSLTRLRLWDYRIEGLFVARPSPWTFGKGSHRHVRRPFTVRVSAALASRSDASLVILLASSLTYEDITTAAV